MPKSARPSVIALAAGSFISWLMYSVPVLVVRHRTRDDGDRDLPLRHELLRAPRGHEVVGAHDDGLRRAHELGVREERPDAVVAEDPVAQLDDDDVRFFSPRLRQDRPRRTARGP